ncbi:MAG: phosphotransferase family protein [Pseudomonadota bacterium]|nr:phosphotransferase family protein [Pseudomonadota bacterium]
MDRHADDALARGEAGAALEAWLRDQVAGYRGPARVEKFAGGQSNPTFKLVAPSGAYVLRRKPIGATLPSAHAVDREFRVLKALQDTDVPTPRVHAYCADVSVAGSPFYVMDFMPGRVFWDPRLPDQTRQERAQIFASLNGAIARIHSLDPQALGLADFGRSGDYLQRQIARWTKQYRAAEMARDSAFEELIAWLPAHAPPEGETRLVHGDYRLDNVLIHPSEPRVVAVLDWELSTLGDPRADFAYHAMAWRIQPALFRGLEGVDFSALGVPDEAQYLETYIRRTGVDPRPHWRFFLVLSLFRIASILQGIARRALDGTAADAAAAEVGAKARPLAERAARLLREGA